MSLRTELIVASLSPRNPVSSSVSYQPSYHDEVSGQCELLCCPSAEQIAVRAGALKANMCASFGEGINQQPIRFDMAIAAAGKFSTERVVPAFRRQRFVIDQPFEHGLEFRHVLAAFLSALDVLLELVGAAESSHMPKSA